MVLRLHFKVELETRLDLGFIVSQNVYECIKMVILLLLSIYLHIFVFKCVHVSIEAIQNTTRIFNVISKYETIVKEVYSSVLKKYIIQVRLN